jgi:hypothetical protein
VVGEAGPGKLVPVEVLGAVRSPASKCDRLVRGVGIPVSFSVGDFIASNERGLIFCPPWRRDARPDGIARPWAELKDG